MDEALCREHIEKVRIQLERGGVDSRMLSVYGVIEYSFLEDLLAVSLGYRYAFLEGEDEGRERFELEQEGTFAGLVLRL